MRKKRMAQVPIGKHCIVCIRNIPNAKVLERLDTVHPILDAIVKECDLHVVGEAGHQFEPFGVTYVHVLEESHMSIHTYPETASCYMDIFCCNQAFQPERAIGVIKALFHVSDADVDWQVIVR
jgi:S-adenosylmethionine decarboxylase